MVSLGFIANGLCLLMGLLKPVSAPTTPRSCKAPAEHHDLFTDAALPNQGHMAYGETCLNICKSGVHNSSALTQALLFQKKRMKKKNSKRERTFLFAGAFCSFALLFSILKAWAAIENQMSSQLLPSNSISGGKQKPANVAGRKRGRGKRWLCRNLFPFLLSLGKVPGETGLCP